MNFSSLGHISWHLFRLISLTEDPFIYLQRRAKRKITKYKVDIPLKAPCSTVGVLRFGGVQKQCLGIYAQYG